MNPKKALALLIRMKAMIPKHMPMTNHSNLLISLSDFNDLKYKKIG